MSGRLSGVSTDALRRAYNWSVKMYIHHAKKSDEWHKIIDNPDTYRWRTNPTEERVSHQKERRKHFEQARQHRDTCAAIRSDIARLGVES